MGLRLPTLFGIKVNFEKLWFPTVTKQAQLT
jgi:hypothetical protein